MFWAVKLRAVGLHFLVTLFIAIISATFIFVVWYPSPYTNIAGGFDLWKLLVGVELTLGPLMSFVVYRPDKSRRALLFDYAVVGVIQVAALLYGVSTLYSARPVFMVFVTERFELVTAVDFDKNELKKAKDWRTSTFGPSLVGVREAENELEKDELMFDTVTSGRDIHLRPKYYTEIDVENVLRKVGELDDLKQKIQNSYLASKIPTIESYDSSYGWLPVKNGFSFWVAIVRKSDLHVTEFLPIDSYELKDF